MGGEGVLRPGGYPQAANGDQCQQADDQQTADRSGFLANDGEDGVGVGRRKNMLLLTLTQADTEQAAPGNGELALAHLVCQALRGLVRVEVAAQSIDTIRCAQDQKDEHRAA